MKISFSNHKKIYKEVFGTEMGKKVLHDILIKCHAMAPAVKKTDQNQHDVFIRVGMQQAALYILSMVEYDVDKYLKEREKYKLEIEHD